MSLLPTSGCLYLAGARSILPLSPSLPPESLTSGFPLSHSPPSRFNLFPFIPIYFSYQPLINRPLPVSELLRRSQRSRRDAATRLLSGFSPGLQADASGSQKGQNLFKPANKNAAPSGLFPRRRSGSRCSLSGASSLLINKVIFTFPDLLSLNLPARPGYSPPTMAAAFPSRLQYDAKLTANALTSQPVKPMKAAVSTSRPPRSPVHLPVYTINRFSAP